MRCRSSRRSSPSSFCGSSKRSSPARRRPSGGRRATMKLITQPADGLAPLLRAIRGARHSLDVGVFRLDLDEVEEALEAAARRGVRVRALVAHMNSDGGKRLRKLEQRMSKRGIRVYRTSDDLTRYHGKLLVVDGRRGFVLGFNYTAADVGSRSFGVRVDSRRLVRELQRLFDCDAERVAYEPRARDLVVSPENARRRLEQFLREARQTLDIYDPELSDERMLRLLGRRQERGVRVRVLGGLEGSTRIEALPYLGGRLHVRAIVRDGRCAFVGSQSLRALELDRRREVGIVIRAASAVRPLQRTFESDWRRAVAQAADAKRAA